MVAFVNPYQSLLSGRDPVESLAQTARELPAQMRVWAPGRFLETYAPGKLTAHRILMHLLHVEMVESVRLRMMLTAPDYVVQTYDPDAWLRGETLDSTPQALAAWSALRTINLVLWQDVASREWDRAFQHPEHGPMTLRHLAALWAGHDLHRLMQLRALERGPSQWRRRHLTVREPAAGRDGGVDEGVDEDDTAAGRP
jgi:hypothetical protein